MTETTPSAVSADKLIRSIAGHCNTTQATAREMLESLEVVITAALVDGRAVRLPGLGTFEPREVPAREGTMGGKAWSKPATRKVVFKASKALRDRIAGPGR